MVDFKEKGKDALACAVKGMHLTQGLQMLQSSLHSVMLSMDQKIDCLGEHGGETACCQRASEKRISGNEWKRYRKDHREKFGTGDPLPNTEGVIPIHAEYP